jgi:hypothetical protein
LIKGGAMSTNKNSTIDSAKGPEWEREMSDKASKMLFELLGFTPTPDELAKIVKNDTVTIHSRDHYEAIMITFTSKGQVVRHYSSSSKAIAGYSGNQTFSVCTEKVPASKAKDRLCRKYLLLLDKRMSARVPKDNSSIIGNINSANEREAKYEMKRLHMITSLLDGMVVNDEKLYDYIQKNSFTLFSRDNYECVNVVLTPNGQVLQSRVNLNASIKNQPVSAITAVWVKHYSVSEAKSKITNEILDYLDKRLGMRLYAS